MTWFGIWTSLDCGIRSACMLVPNGQQQPCPAAGGDAAHPPHLLIIWWDRDGGAKGLEDFSFGHNTAQRKGKREDRMITVHLTYNLWVVQVSEGQILMGSLDQNTQQALPQPKPEISSWTENHIQALTPGSRSFFHHVSICRQLRMLWQKCQLIRFVLRSLRLLYVKLVLSKSIKCSQVRKGSRHHIAPI